jgi:hypothetical protein
LEWGANGVGTIGVTPGYPNNISIGNNTTIDYNNGTPSNKAIAGNLSIELGSSLYLDFGPPLATNGDLTVAGFINNKGNFTLADDVGDDLYLGGNFENLGNFNSNGKAIFFTKNGLQTVSSTTPLTLSYVVQQPVAGINTVQLLNDLLISAPAGGNALSFTNATDIFDLNGRNLTIGTAATANTILGIGTFKGSSTSNLSIIGNGSIGTIGFTTGFQNLGTFNIDRIAGAIACVLSSPVQINTALSLTNGIIDLGNNPMTIGATAGIINASASNYIIADVANGANASLRKVFTAAGAFTFPIGDGLATANGSQYSPSTLTFTGGSYAGGSYAGVAVDDIKNTNLDASTDFISRYWKVTSAVMVPTSYVMASNYFATDVNGTETNCLSNQWNGANWLNNGSNAGTNTLSVTATALPAINHFTKGLRNAEINIKQGVTNYFHNSTYVFGSQIIGTNTDVIFTIENLGQQDLTFSAVNITGTGYSFATAFTLAPNIVGPTGTRTFTIRFNPNAIGSFAGSVSFTTNDATGAENPYVINFNGQGLSQPSDLVYVTGSAITTGVSSIINIPVLTATTGVQVMQLIVRDGSGVSDADSLPTILNSLTITQNAGTNGVANWQNAIQTISLFDDSGIKLVDGLVTATTISFSGLAYSTPDNTNKTLTIRLSLKCPLGVGVLDGQDFGFLITAANTTFAAAGSSIKASFTDFANLNTTNAISVIATKLEFTTQPLSTGLNNAMSNVIVRAFDSCGNIDLNFTNSIAVTSTGTMTGNPVSINAVAGVATFIALTHTVVGLGLTLTATSTGLTSIVSNPFDILVATVLNRGDLAILAVNSTAASPIGDEFSFVCFQDMLPGTQLYFTDNGYERDFAGLWGDSEGVFSISRINTTITKGTIISIKSNGGISSAANFTVSSCGIEDFDWTKSMTSPATTSFDLNKDDQIWIMQGGTWGGLADATPHNATHVGNVLYGWTDITWKTAPAWPPLTSGDTRSKGSTIYPGYRCYSTDVNNPDTGASRVKFDDPIDPDFTVTTRDKLDWIALINDPANWDAYTSTPLYDAGGYNYQVPTVCKSLTITPGTFVSGQWTGLKDTNWFNCNNWDTLEVPTAATNVILSAPKSLQNTDIIATATDADLFGNIAKCNNLTISARELQIRGNINNKLEVNGNLIVNGTGLLNMSDLVTGTADGQLYLKGNWDNQLTETAFLQGEGTVHLNGTTIQDVKAVGSPEKFYNLIIDNPSSFSSDDFHNDVIAEGNLELKNGGDLLIKTGQFGLAGKNLTVGLGSVLEIQDKASFTQTDDTGVVTNNGTTIVNKKGTPYSQFDYTYWSSPIVNETTGSVFAGYSPTRMFKHDASVYNDQFGKNASNTIGWPQVQGVPDSFDDEGDDWTIASGTITPGRGYIVMGSNAQMATGQTVVFTETGVNGRLNNGVIPIPVYQDRYNQLGFTGAPTFNTNSNLIGNPYASAINLVKLKADNPILTGTFYFWSHDTPISNSTPGPWAYNFTNDDFVTYTVGTGGTNTGCVGCILPTQFVASGQAFQANTTGNGTINFNNSQRVSGNNSNFYRLNPENRLWLKFKASNTETRQILIGFMNGATDGYEAEYDGLRLENGSGFDFYSYLSENPEYRLAVNGLGVFDEAKSVPLGIETIQTGTNEISIDQSEGIFANNQEVYLEDQLTNTLHDLRSGPYSFNSIIGDAINNRFILRFSNPLAATSFNNNDSNVVVYNNSKNEITVQSTTENIESVSIYDLLGRKIISQKNVIDKKVVLSNINAKNQTLLVKTKLQNGIVVTTKIIL